MTEILYNSDNVRQAIVKLFDDPSRRRVAIVAFVGYGAEAYLPNPAGLELYCWPEPGSTDPDVIRRLIKRKADIWFVEGLHMKVYWSEGKGAIITSANLSTSALGRRNLKEAGVLLNAEQLDIDRLIQSLRAHRPSEIEFRQLDRRHKQHRIKNPDQFVFRVKGSSYREWYESPFKKQWKLAVINGTIGLASEAKRKSKEDYNIAEPENWISDDRKDYKQFDWILSFSMEHDRPKQIEWVSVDFFVRVPNRNYPYQYVQVWPRTLYPPPPFRLDKPFRNALSKAIQNFGLSKLEESTVPSETLLKLIYRYYTSLSQ